MLRAFSVCVARNWASFIARSPSSVASIAIANSAAFDAPASPMANVATGTPRGICTIDSSESSPRRYLDGIGTPSTGMTVLEASMPGRCAAPPAPAMMAFRPRSRALSAYANISSGMRCADSTLASNETPNSFRIVQACCITSQSELEPMTTPIDAEPLRVVIAMPVQRTRRIAPTAGKSAIVARGARSRASRVSCR